MDEFSNPTTTLRGIQIFGFGSLVPMSLIEPSSPIFPHMSEESFFNNYEEYKFTTSNPEMARLRPELTLERSLNATPRTTSYKTPIRNSSTNISGFNSPTRISSSNNIMHLDKAPHGDGSFPKTLSELNFTSQLMDSIVTKAELGRVVMGIYDEMNI